MWGADCICYDYPEFYEKGNEKAIHYQSLIHKQAAEILFKNKDKKEPIMENYGTYLAYVKYRDDRKVHYKENVNLGDEYESDWQERETVNYALVKQLILEAANNGDEFAKKILAL